MAMPRKQSTIAINDTSSWQRFSSIFIECPQGHYAHRFLACDASSFCWFRGDHGECESSLSSLLPSFSCTNQEERVPYQLVCDFRRDCSDGGDEDFCFIPPCMGAYFKCDNGQCISTKKICDGWTDCLDGEDEKCPEEIFGDKTIPPPALVSVSKYGRFVIRPLPAGICPDSHFQCPHNGYCLPVLLRCNGVLDCPGREDEDCETCPGFYRCRGSKVCLHFSDVCDGHPHCRQHDDELCSPACPESCSCKGQVFLCNAFFDGRRYRSLRYLDASGSGLTLKSLMYNKMLINLTLANCSLTYLHDAFNPNLISLNVKDNLLVSISLAQLVSFFSLRELCLAGNPLNSVFEHDGGSRGHRHLLKLDLSRVVMHAVNGTQLSVFPNLQYLILSHSKTERVTGEMFRGLKQLRVLDLRGCPMTWISHGMFQGLNNLRIVRAQSFKVCCPAALPMHFNNRNCFAPSDEVSSCDDLLRGTIYKVGVFVLSLLAMGGNVVSFTFRTCISKRENKQGYGIFVTHLSASDFLMGIYLAIIGVADQVYRGTYLWSDGIWRHSNTCKLAGFLSLVSSEVSAIIVCLITLDRFLVLCFPFSLLRFSAKFAHMVSGVVWIGVAFIAALPLTSSWEFYSQSGICIPLPITSNYFVGHNYSFGILIVFNFVVFVFISMGQLIIYWSIHTNSMTVSSTTMKSKDLSIARRLITVAMTDFLCWFPIGLFGLLASSGVPILDEINVALAIFVLPLNSAVNPCLYTLNVMMERRNRAREEKLRVALLAQLKSRA